MKRKLRILLCALLLGCIMSACTKAEEVVPQATSEPLADWKVQGFQVEEDIEVNQTVWTGKYQVWEHGLTNAQEEEENGVHISKVSYGVCENIFWYFGRITGEDGLIVPGPEGEYVLDCYDASKECFSRVQFKASQMGVTGEQGYLMDMDMLAEGQYMFRWAEYVYEEELYRQVSDVFVFTDLEGECEQYDFYEIFAEKKLEDYRATILPMSPSAECHGDGKGNIWLTHYRLGKYYFYLFDRKGTLLMEYEGSEDQLMMDTFFTHDKELILPIYDERQRCYEFLWVDVEGKQFTSLAKMKTNKLDIRQFYGMSENNIYYRALKSEATGGECIVCWNILTGTRTEIYEFTMAGYSTLLAAMEPDHMWLRVMSVKIDNFKDWVVPLTSQKQVTDAVTVAGFVENGELLQAAVTKASMENPNAQYIYEDATSEEARTRILAQMSQGEGPDILCVPMWDFYSMTEKGMLQNLEGLISQETKQALLPAVLQMGEVENTLLGVTPSVYVETFAVSESLETNGQWRLEDIIELMEEGKLTGSLRSLYVFPDYLQPVYTVEFLLSENLGNSFLIDWQQGECHFEDEKFIRLLELTYQDMSNQTAEELQETDLIYAHMSYEYALIDFFTKVETDGLQIIGYPGGNGASYLCEDGGMVVVNKNCTDLEAVEFFLETLLGEEIQERNTALGTLGVRKLNPEVHLVRDEQGVAWWMGSKPILNYEDGTTPLHQAAEFLEACVPAPRRFTDIDVIIMQELENMQAEGKSAEETAIIIDNRIQLYLDE